MTQTQHKTEPEPPRTRTRARTRQVGYVVAAVANALLLFAVNVWPGWEQVPFLTRETELVLMLVNSSIVVSLVANVVYAVHYRTWVKALGDVITTWVGLLAAVKIWQIFPFDFEGSTGWDLLTRTLLVVAIGGSIIGIIAGLSHLVKALHDEHE